MIFAKLDVCFHDHPRFIRAGLEACAYWTGVLSWLRRNDSRDGVIPADCIGLILNVGNEKALELCKRLVEVGLFEAKEFGYLLLRYSEKNESREEIDARRAATRDRVAKHRQNLRNKTANNVTSQPVTQDGNAVTVPQGTGSDSDSGSALEEGEPERGSGVRPTRHLEYRQAYELGMRRAAAGWVMPDKQDGELHQALSAFSKGRRGAELDAWISDQAERFARYVSSLPADELRFWSDCGPKHFLRWLNQGAIAAAPLPSHGPKARADSERRDREAREYMAKAGPPPPGLLTAAIDGKGRS